MVHLALVAALYFFTFSSDSAHAEKRSDTDTTFCERDWEDIELCTPIGGEDIVDPCGDQNELCGHWAAQGECDNNPNYMLSSCARSCKQCPSFFKDPSESVTDSCLDIQEKCSEWAREGECEKNPNYMSVNCARTCEKCDKKDTDSGTSIPQKANFDGMEQDEVEAAKAHINAMMEYNSLYRNNPDATSKTLKLCKNQLDKCAYYASKGLCKERVIFMMDNCPLACMMCDKAQQFNECVGMREPHSLPVFISESEYDILKNDDSNDSSVIDQVQTVDSFFHSKRGSDDWTESGAEYIIDSSYTLNNDGKSNDDDGGPWIVRFGNFLKPEECKAIIDLGHSIGLKESNNKMPLQQESKDQMLTSSFKNAKCSQSKELCNDHSVLSSIEERIAKVVSISKDYFEPAEIVLYSGASNGFHSLHHDHDIHDSWKLAGPRVLSFYIPLSDVKEGGYLGFPAMDWLMIPPQVGQMIVWPNVLGEDPMTADWKMEKEVLPPQQDDMYVLHIRAHQYNYTSANLRGCV